MILSRALFLGVLVLGACSDPQPPVGRWQGVYEDAGVIIAARLEISQNGAIRVSAPNAITGESPLPPEERDGLRRRLEDGLAVSWPSVEPLRLQFDGKAFRKPGGVAPQLEWDSARRQMTLVYYSGNRSSVRVPLTAVSEFGS
jgi:hypothetical protein